MIEEQSQLVPVTLFNGCLVCNKCGQIMRAKTISDEFKNTSSNSPLEMQTLVGYYSPPGHCHDDNCLTRIYVCPNGHTRKIGKRRHCYSCEWVGKERCFCHDGLKVEEWPKNSDDRTV